MRSAPSSNTFFALVLTLIACGGRSFPGSQDDTKELFPVANNSAGGAGNSAGGHPSGGANLGGTLSGGTHSGGNHASGTASGGNHASGTASGGNHWGGMVSGGNQSGGNAGFAASPMGGSGGNTPLGPCGSCLVDAGKNGECGSELKNCEKTKGCVNYGECFRDAGCLDHPNPQVCGKKSGCDAPPKARQAFEDLTTCLACDSCQDTCDVPPDMCGGDLEQQCATCQEGAFNICQDSYWACTKDPGCNTILTCLQACPEDDTCYQNCYNDNPEGQQAYYALYYCYYCTACDSTCGKLVPEFCQ